MEDTSEDYLEEDKKYLKPTNNIKLL